MALYHNVDTILLLLTQFIKNIVHDMSWFNPPFALEIDDQTREPMQSGQRIRDPVKNEQSIRAGHPPIILGMENTWKY